MKIKRFNQALQKSDLPELPPTDSVSKWDVLFAAPKTCNWQNGMALEMLIDSGASQTCIPFNLLTEPFVSNLKLVGEDTATLANGETITSKIALVDLRIETLIGGDIVIQELPVCILEEGDEGLLGADVLSLIDFCNVNGKITFLRPAETYNRLEDAKFDSITSLGNAKTASNTDAKDNVAKPPKSPAEPTPLKNAFGKPSKPQGPKRSR